MINEHSLFYDRALTEELALLNEDRTFYSSST